jgi:hypothetical protein
MGNCLCFFLRIIDLFFGFYKKSVMQAIDLECHVYLEKFAILCF